VLGCAALSDILDGALARLLKQETPLGMALDPIADKILMTTAYLTLAFRDAVPWWLSILVISRDAAILITSLLIILVAGYRTFRPSVLGKASTVVQAMTILVALAFAARLPLVTASWVQLFVYLAATITVVSGIHYAIVVRHRYAHPVAEDSSPPGPTGAATPEDGESSEVLRHGRN
jgi:cardiolipin synthase